MQVWRPLLLGAFIAAGAFACGSSATTNLTSPTASKCQVTLTNPSSTFESTGGTGALTVTSARECAWTASTSSPWVQITSGASGQGDGSVRYRVSENGDPVARQASITVSDQHASVVQSAAPCQYGVSAPTAALAANGGSAPVSVQTHSACRWTASTSADWITVSPSSGQGAATIAVVAAPNTGPERTVTLTIGSGNVVLHQLPAPNPPPAPQPTPTPAPTPPPAPNPPPSPTPEPPPPSPPPPAPNPSPDVTLSGRVDHLQGSCPALRFDLSHKTVTTSAATDFQAGPCEHLKKGSRVSVTGIALDKRTIAATVVHFDK